MILSLHQGLAVTMIIFLIGVFGLLTKKNLILILLSIEIMLNAAGVAFVLVGAHLGKADGQVMFIFILAVAAAEVAVGLALILRCFKEFKSINISEPILRRLRS